MSYYNNYLFSESFIKEMLSQELNDVNHQLLFNLSENLKDYFEPFKNETRSNENDFFEDFLDVILDILDFHKHHVSDKNNLRILSTDYSIENAVCLCYFAESKVNLDDTKKGKFIPFYALKEANKRNINWVMVTNGIKWRLYNKNSINKYEEFLEVDFEELFYENKVNTESLLLFYSFFHVKNFFREKNKLKIDNYLKHSRMKNDSLEVLLKSRIDGILHDICYGFKSNIEKNNTELNRIKIYEDSIIFLYRLLFYAYAESRGLLPINDSDDEYIDYSFENITTIASDLLINNNHKYDLEGFELWDKLDKYLRIYTNKAYNGGLFTNKNRTILENFKISNRFLAKCLVDLTYIDSDEDLKNKINFKDLSVRSLGSIYEGILEYNLYVADERLVKRTKEKKVVFESAKKIPPTTSEHKNIIEKGEIYLSHNMKERKESGSYYTPEDVVNYILEMTVVKKINQIKVDYELQNQKDFTEFTDKELFQFVTKEILNLSIIDSSMGSGHFLVNVVYKISNLIIEILSENNSTNKTIDLNPIEWRRRVVENCIYGIDMNYLAVHLSKLSLWLISVEKNKPFPFLDHKLKLGNSIFGTSASDFFKNNINIYNFKKFIDKYNYKYDAFLSMVENTKDEVHKKRETFRNLETEMSSAKLILNRKMAKEFFLNEFNKTKQKELLNEIYLNENKYNEIFDQISRENKFFHWELEFPSVFQKGGFDIFVGNPPYIEAMAKDYYPVKYTKSCGNIYTYIIEKTFENIKENGLMGVILPTASISTPRMKPFQEFILENSKETFISTYDDRPSKIFMSLDGLKVSIIISQKNKIDEKNLFVTGSNRWYHHERDDLFNNINYSKLKKYKYIDGYIPKISKDIESSILEKIFSIKSKMEQYLDTFVENSNRNIYYGYGARYWIRVLPFSDSDSNRKSTGEKSLTVIDDVPKEIIHCILSSSLFYWYYQQFSDCRNVTQNTIKNFPFDISLIDKKTQKELINLSSKLTQDYLSNSEVREINHKGTGKLRQRQYKIKKSKDIINEIDQNLGKVFGLTKDEVKFLIEFQLKFRMGDE